MVIMGEYNESFEISIENDEPTITEGNSSMRNIKGYHHEDVNSKRLNPYTTCSNIKSCDRTISQQTESSTSYNCNNNDEYCDDTKSIQLKRSSSCYIDICTELNSIHSSTSSLDYTVDDYYEESNSSSMPCSNNADVVEERNSCTKTSPLSTNNIETTNIGIIFYNCDTSNPTLQLNMSLPNTTLTAPVATSELCCACETGPSLVCVNTTIIENTIFREKALVTPIAGDLNKCCCDETAYKTKLTPQTSNSLTTSITERSCDDELPTYRSLIAFRLQDSPPNYESVTGIRVNIDEIRKDVSSYARNRLRREVRTCSDLNKSAKRLLVLMAAIIVAICIVMIILTL